jgi:type III restriction enzyme
VNDELLTASMELPTHITENLNPAFELRPYQVAALNRFVEEANPEGRTHLFHMATGSGKTLLMAGLILHLFERGYRNFLFFVNSTNILAKTRANFLQKNTSKYLLNENLKLNGQVFSINEVQHFQESSNQNIQILFSTIQGLHMRLQSPKESAITVDDFAETPIVFISDEAHHINAETKNKNSLSAEERSAILSWESTVSQILGANSKSMLLEFTATADFSHPEIAAKYSDKLLFEYPLRQFRLDGYSKEVQVLQANLPPFERALQAVILSQYRLKIFEQFGIQAKPVLLFKSKTIKESQQFHTEFITKIQTLTDSDFHRILSNLGQSQLAFIPQYFEKNKINGAHLIHEIKSDFSEAHLLIVNSKDETEEKQLALNSLEDERNLYRAIFAVDKLNEGWDVLNLFDIVRLYDTQDQTTAKTTVAEAQLIGRGARYFPFRLQPDQPMYQRKYDTDTSHPLRICEELFYHSAYNPKYIRDLHSAMEEIGIKAKKDENTFNSAQKAPKKPISSTKAIFDQEHRVALFSGEMQLSNQSNQSVVASQLAVIEETILLASLGEPVLRKAINQLPAYQFSRLKNRFPKLQSISELLASETYLGKTQVTVSGSDEQLQQLNAEERLFIAEAVLGKIAERF